ncbi:hypothetical protein B0H14DRAFT_45761 [Mycena olivaceomarginata]|nr:hypothetical protein B0H14DRAFT_45761 [Mycena olivaceomarginata]
MSHGQASDVLAPIPRHGMAVVPTDLRYRPRRACAVHFATRARARLQGSLRDQDDRRLAVPRFRLSTLPATKAEELRLELRFVVPRTKLNVVSPRLSTPASYSTHARNLGLGRGCMATTALTLFSSRRALHCQLDGIGTPSEQKNPLTARPTSTQGARPVARHLGERVVEAVPSGGNDPAFAVPFSTGEVAIMNYSSGDRRIIPTTTSPEHYNNDAPVITFPPPARGVSHPDLNPKGSGPITGSTPYELASTLPSPPSPDSPPSPSFPPILPPPTARFGRCIHVSNRRTGNSITIFENVGQGPGEKLLVMQVFMELNQIRGVHRCSLVERTMSI